MDEITANSDDPSWIRPTVALGSFTSHADLMSGDDQVAESSDVRYGFHVGDLGLLVGTDIGAEVTPIPAAVRIPGSPLWVMGVSNLRGSLVTVFDLPLLFGLPRSNSDDESYGLVLDTGDNAVGIQIGQYPQALDGLKLVTETPPLPDALLPFVDKTYRKNESLWIEFDFRRFFSSLVKHIED